LFWKEKNITVVAISHDINEMMYLVTDIIVLNSNQITTVSKTFNNPFQGNLKAIREKPDEYFKLYDAIRKAM
jgi:ABC-type nitrate/sulfonate/bicarbonate transport system ATPase subunit